MIALFESNRIEDFRNLEVLLSAVPDIDRKAIHSIDNIRRIAMITTSMKLSRCPVKVVRGDGWFFFVGARQDAPDVFYFDAYLFASDMYTFKYGSTVNILVQRRELYFGNGFPVTRDTKKRMSSVILQAARKFTSCRSIDDAMAAAKRVEKDMDKYNSFIMGKSD